MSWPRQSTRSLEPTISETGEAKSSQPTPAEEHSVSYGTETIQFCLRRDEHKTLRVSVRPDGSVLVAAPSGASLDDILLRVRKRAGWIEKQREYFRQVHQEVPPRQYVSGETHLYLGRQYRLKVQQGERNEVKLSGRFFHVTTIAAPDAARVKSLLDAWYLEHARTLFPRRLVRCLAHLTAHGVQNPRLIVRAMASRWGSCSRSGTITLNRHLIKAPVHCVDYVITHELCHLRHYGHTRAFYSLLAQVMPDWLERRQRLARVFPG